MKAVFLASLPPIQGAIKIGQDGMRVQLDIPLSEMEEGRKLIDMAGKVLSVAIVAEEKGADGMDKLLKGME
jgi:hypothetical protein